MEHPHIVLNWIAIVAAVVGAFVWGGLYYGPIMGRAWAKEMGMDMSQKPDASVMKRAMIIQLIGCFLASYVLAHTLQVWRPSAWGMEGQDGSDAMYGFFNGLFIWIGFYIPLQMNKVAWEKRTWKLFFINTVHDFVNLQIMSQILAHIH